MPRVRVLLAEDDIPLADAITRGLRRSAIAVDASYSGATALEKLHVVNYDVLVLDRDLPEIHGHAVCRSVVASEMPTRILMLTAASSVNDRVEGLGVGADDYLTKPFAMDELVARVRALARRVQRARPPV